MTIDSTLICEISQLICTVTPASSNMEETHNTLKFASRAKRVEIYASRNKVYPWTYDIVFNNMFDNENESWQPCGFWKFQIIDEKSLIKKYQREISSLKEELDQLRRGMLIGVSHEEIMSLRQKVIL